MNLFKTHAQAAEGQAKDALVQAARRIIGGYITIQRSLNEALLAGDTEQNCLTCKIDKATKMMAKLHSQINEVAKTHELMFGEELDTKVITEELLDEVYPLINPNSKSPGEPKGKSGIKTVIDELFGKNVNGLEDVITSKLNGTPEGREDAINTYITDLLNEAGLGGVSVHAIEVHKGLKDKKGALDLNPSDFPSFKEFYQAVKAASKASEDSENNVSGEQTIIDAIVSNAEKNAQVIDEEATKSAKKDTKNNKGGKPSLN